MTDKEIIQALECCAEEKCWECLFEPTKFKKGTFGCCDELKKCALDLINRQQAEIERLKEKYDRTMTSLKAVLDERADHTEAIKEFAEWLKESNHGTLSYCTGWVDFDDIDNLVKEMVGDDK